MPRGATTSVPARPALSARPAHSLYTEDEAAAPAVATRANSNSEKTNHKKNPPKGAARAAPDAPREPVAPAFGFGLRYARLSLPPSSERVTWHTTKREPPVHPRQMCSRVRMYADVDVDSRGLMRRAHTPPLLRYVLVRFGGEWHGFDHAAVYDEGLTERALRLLVPHSVPIPDRAAAVEALRSAAVAVHTLRGQLNAACVHTPLDEVHAAFYVHYIERGVDAPADALVYEQMMHAAVKEDASSGASGTSGAEYGARVREVARSGVFAFLRDANAHIKMCASILICLFLRFLSVYNEDTTAEGAWYLSVLVAVLLCAVQAAGWGFAARAAGSAGHGIGKWVVGIMPPWYRGIIQNRGTPATVIKCTIRFFAPFVMQSLILSLAAIVPLVALAAPVLTPVLLQAIDQLIGSEYMGPWCSPVDLAGHAFRAARTALSLAGIDLGFKFDGVSAFVQSVATAGAQLNLERLVELVGKEGGLEQAYLLVKSALAAAAAAAGGVAVPSWPSWLKDGVSGYASQWTMLAVIAGLATYAQPLDAATPKGDGTSESNNRMSRFMRRLAELGVVHFVPAGAARAVMSCDIQGPMLKESDGALQRAAAAAAAAALAAKTAAEEAAKLKESAERAEKEKAEEEKAEEEKARAEAAKNAEDVPVDDGVPLPLVEATQKFDAAQRALTEAGRNLDAAKVLQKGGTKAVNEADQKIKEAQETLDTKNRLLANEIQEKNENPLAENLVESYKKEVANATANLADAKAKKEASDANLLRFEAEVAKLGGVRDSAASAFDKALAAFHRAKPSAVADGPVPKKTTPVARSGDVERSVERSVELTEVSDAIGNAIVEYKAAVDEVLKLDNDKTGSAPDFMRRSVLNIAIKEHANKTRSLDGKVVADEVAFHDSLKALSDLSLANMELTASGTSYHETALKNVLSAGAKLAGKLELYVDGLDASNVMSSLRGDFGALPYERVNINYVKDRKIATLSSRRLEERELNQRCDEAKLAFFAAENADVVMQALLLRGDLETARKAHEEAREAAINVKSVNGTAVDLAGSTLLATLNETKESLDLIAARASEAETVLRGTSAVSKQRGRESYDAALSAYINSVYDMTMGSAVHRGVNESAKEKKERYAYFAKNVKLITGLREEATKARSVVSDAATGASTMEALRKPTNADTGNKVANALANALGDGTKLVARAVVGGVGAAVDGVAYAAWSRWFASSVIPARVANLVATNAGQEHARDDAHPRPLSDSEVRSAFQAAKKPQPAKAKSSPAKAKQATTGPTTPPTTPPPTQQPNTNQSPVPPPTEGPDPVQTTKESTQEQKTKPPPTMRTGTPEPPTTEEPTQEQKQKTKPPPTMRTGTQEPPTTEEPTQEQKTKPLPPKSSGKAGTGGSVPSSAPTPPTRPTLGGLAAARAAAEAKSAAAQTALDAALAAQNQAARNAGLSASSLAARTAAASGGAVQRGAAEAAKVRPAPHAPLEQRVPPRVLVVGAYKGRETEPGVVAVHGLGAVASVAGNQGLTGSASSASSAGRAFWRGIRDAVADAYAPLELDGLACVVFATDAEPDVGARHACEMLGEQGVSVVPYTTHCTSTPPDAELHALGAFAAGGKAYVLSSRTRGRKVEYPHYTDGAARRVDRYTPSARLVAAVTGSGGKYAWGSTLDVVIDGIAAKGV